MTKTFDLFKLKELVCATYVVRLVTDPSKLDNLVKTWPLAMVVHFQLCMKM